MNDVDVLVCDKCGATVPTFVVQFHMGKSVDVLAWDHRVHSEDRCNAYSALRNHEGAPIEASARLANRLNIRGSARRITVVGTDDTLAYQVADVPDLLWVSARLVAPLGLEPRLTLSSSRPSMSTLRSETPLGVLHHDADEVEYIYLRLGVGDWLLLKNGGAGPALQKMSDKAFRQMLHKAGVSDIALKEKARELDVS